jgi:leucyl aminopeptidase
MKILVLYEEAKHSGQVIYSIEKGLSPLQLQEIGGKIAALLPEDEEAVLDLRQIEEGEQIAMGCRLKRWSFDKYQNKKKSSLTILGDYPPTPLEKGILLARELTCEPANRLPPKAFVKRCLALKEFGIEVEVYDKKALAQMGAGAILSVGQGSVNEPYIVTLRLGSNPSVALVGKGVCYDAGGIHLKSSHLTEMKWDKAGAAAVVGTMLTAALQKMPVPLVGVIGLVENMPSGSAYKPGDILDTLMGKTVEVVDTDNEGRLVLADCLTFAQKQFHPKIAIDLGTLTLEAHGALAAEYAAIFTDDEELFASLQKAGEETQERLWRLPLGRGFAKQIESEFADLKNSGTPGFGESSAAAEFLKAFVEPPTRFAHLDIGGVAWTSEETPLAKAGVTGFGVKLLTRWLNLLH